MPDEARWFYGRDGQQLGPVTLTALQALVGTGQLRPFDLVWREGMPQWVQASTVPKLFPSGSVAPGAVPPPLAHGQAQYGPGGEDIGQNAGMRMLLPVGRSGWAIAAGYLGLFSLLPIFAPLALIISIIAIRDIKTHPQRHGMGRAIFGLIMGGIFTFLLILMIVLTATR
jgi:hypothetical protein